MIELFVVGATLTVLAWAKGSDVRRRSVASQAMDRYAASRRLRFLPASAARRGASPRVIGAQAGLAYVIDLYRLDGEMRTRVSATAPHAASVSVSKRGAFRWKEESVLRSGDPALDAAYVASRGTAEDIDKLRELAAPLLYIHRREGVWLDAGAMKVTLSWRGLESDPLVLDAARDIVVGVAGWHRPASPYR